MRKTVSIVSPSAQKCIDNFPRLLVSVPRDNGLVARKTFVQVEYHFFSDPSPRNDQRPAGHLFANRDTSVAFAMYSRSLSVDLHVMSLNIDMKIVRPWNCAGSPILFMNSWTSSTGCNLVNPGKYSTRIPSVLRQLCPKFCIVVNL